MHGCRGCQVFQLINDRPTGATQSSFEKGSTIPVTSPWRQAGVRISDAAAQALVNGCGARMFWVQSAATTGGAADMLNTDPANAGNCFRYDASPDQFVYNLGTRHFTTGTWTLIARVFSGGAEHAVSVTVQ